MYWLNGLNTSHRLCQGLEMWHCALPGMAFGRSSPDLSGHNRNAVSVTDVSHWSSVYAPPGVSYGQSLWSPAGTRMTVAGTGGFRPASCTLIASVKLTSESNQVTLSNRSGVSYTGLLMYFTGGSLAILGSSSGANWELFTTGGIALGTLWHRCAVTYDAATGTARTYIDAKQDLAATITPASLGWEAADWHVYSEPSVPFFGFQSDSKVYSRALSAAEIREEYVESLTGNRRLFAPSSVARRAYVAAAPSTKYWISSGRSARIIGGGIGT